MEKTENEHNKEFMNISYIFIPFCMRNGNIDTFKNRFSESDTWDAMSDELKYIFKFVANKVDGSDNHNRCVHYVRKHDKISILNKPLIGNFKSELNIQQNWRGKFPLTIEDMEIYMFSTNVGMFVFRVVVGSDDPAVIIDARYNMKSVSKTEYALADDIEKNKEDINSCHSYKLIDIAREEIGLAVDDLEIEFFYYVYKHSVMYETAFVQSFVYMKEDGDYSEEINYLRMNLGRHFHLTKKDNFDENEVFSISENIRWGISDQSAVCIGIHLEGDNFVEKILYNNFGKEYKYMFAFLLHQKYTLYYFLTQIDTRLRGSLRMLEDYRSRLGEFKTYFAFRRISETVQYQSLYEKVQKVFDFDNMYNDVEDPLSLITDIVQERTEKRQKWKDKKNEKRNDNLNILLAMMTLLTVFSALTDAFDWGQKLPDALKSVGQSWEYVLSMLFNLVVLIISAIVILKAVKLLIGHRKSKGGNNMETKNCLYTAVFVDNEDLKYAIKDIRRNRLENDIEHKHVTVEYKPKEKVPAYLLGKTVHIKIVGYGCDGKNEGLQVELHPENDELNEMINKIKVPHITLSIGKGCKAKDTSDIEFTDIDPIEIDGVFGVMLKSGEYIVEE